MRVLAEYLKRLRGGSINCSFFYDNQEIFYKIKTDKKLKNLYITISPEHGVVVKNPNFCIQKVQEIVDLKAKWIYTKLLESKQKLSIKKIYKNEGKILYLGKKVALHVEALEKFYKDKTKEIVLNEIEQISKEMDLKPNKISFRKTKRRWGSCNHKNEISFTISLAQLPLECIQYIIVHELSHIKHKNHKREFYKTIETYLPNFKKLESMLKNYSPSIT